MLHGKKILRFGMKQGCVAPNVADAIRYSVLFFT